jgi:hypothetical protein
MKSVTSLACVVVITLGTAAFAQDRQNEQAQQRSNNQSEQASEQRPEQSEEESRLQEVTCRTEPVLGSRTRVNRVCMTRAEWNQLAQETRRGQDQMMRNANKNQACSYGQGC